jgi:peptidyl-prolyl cis-trans isomerase B (cyclophilin B)
MENYFSETNPTVTMVIKGLGTIKLELFNEVAPNTVNNFCNLVKEGYYNGLTFHRIIKGFMIQGGWGKETGCQIKGEFASNGINNPLKHKRGVISMARTMVKDSATSQFFIMHQDAPHLDGEYAAFGAMTEGFDVLDKVASVKTDYSDKPLEAVTIESIEVDLKNHTLLKTVCV